MSENDTEVWITGIGLVSSLGEGLDEHWQKLTACEGVSPVVDAESFKPYPVHPLIELDYSQQIPRRQDQRQMGAWQKLGTYTAGLALDDAGISGNEALLAKTNLIVAAGGGERDLEVDASLLDTADNQNEGQKERNDILMNDLRPTHFLSELSNLLAGNISIVHGVVGSSRTFMGEEMAGFSAVEVAAKRIENQQGELFLVGAAFNAERDDMYLHLDLGNLLWSKEYKSLWERATQGGGMVLGSLSAFLVMESKAHAQARGAKPYAKLSGITSARSSRAEGQVQDTANQQFKGLGSNIPVGPLAYLSGSSGVENVAKDEMTFANGLRSEGYDVAIRGYGSVFGHSLEAQFPTGLILASMAVSKGGFYPPFDTSGKERDSEKDTGQIIVTTWAPFRGEGMALVEKVV